MQAAGHLPRAGRSPGGTSPALQLEPDRSRTCTCQTAHFHIQRISRNTRLTMVVALFHRPACRIAARPIPEAIMSWAAPTRALWPGNPSAKSLYSSRTAMDL